MSKWMIAFVFPSLLLIGCALDPMSQSEPSVSSVEGLQKKSKARIQETNAEVDRALAQAQERTGGLDLSTIKSQAGNPASPPALGEGVPEEVQEAFENLSGVFEGLQDIIQDLEEAAQNQDPAAIEDLLEDLQEQLDELKQACEELINNFSGPFGGLPAGPKFPF